MPTEVQLMHRQRHKFSLFSELHFTTCLREHAPSTASGLVRSLVSAPPFRLYDFTK